MKRIFGGTEMSWEKDLKKKYTRTPKDCEIELCRAITCGYNAHQYNGQQRCTLPQVDLDEEGRCVKFNSLPKVKIGRQHEEGREPEQVLPIKPNKGPMERNKPWERKPQRKDEVPWRGYKK